MPVDATLDTGNGQMDKQWIMQWEKKTKTMPKGTKMCKSGTENWKLLC